MGELKKENDVITPIVVPVSSEMNQEKKKGFLKQLKSKKKTEEKNNKGCPKEKKERKNIKTNTCYLAIFTDT